MHGVTFALTENLSPTTSEKQIECWIHANKVCRHNIIFTLSNELFDVYCPYKESKEIWDNMILSYTAEDVGKQKFIIEKFYRWEMTEDVEVKVQINEYHKLLEDLKSENITLPEEFVAELLIEKLPPSCNDYKQQLKHKHKHKQLSLKELITRIIIEKINRKEVMNANKREFTTRANLIEENAKRGMGFRHNSRFRNHAMPKSNNSRNNVMPINHAMPKFNNPTFKKKGNCCYVCGKLGHYAHQCRHQKGRHKNHAQSHVNLVKADEIIVAIVSQANIVTNMTE
ncbi:hypothetical protein like AT4G00980 [Hibiscus trionum]|uniref:CCHC-type domain-containing protein n=1 Tax=Hibiscus trionum TaxID=183268 RepID=A0A9W7MUX3_HIBTR|nr:hypothetical protein like AT4G00980 [Hibiscus trionum]